MEYTPVSSFRRPLTAVHLKHQTARRPPPDTVSKWDALRRLATARQHYGLSDRDLTVLQTLLGFHPETELGGNSAEPIVYPSNKAICERLNGMPCSTMRRHIGRLVDAGVILRRDSPNGKRYVRRSGGPKLAFGFDLAPLASRFEEFSRIASEIEATDARRKRLRDTVSLMRRDLAGYVDYGVNIVPNLPIWDGLGDLARLAARDLRRKLSVEDLAALKTKLQAALAEAVTHIDAPVAADPSISDADIEHHHQNSNKEYFDEKCEVVDRPKSTDPSKHQPPPLRQVLDNCKEIQSYSPDGVQDWNDLIRLADTVSPMMGIQPSVWNVVKSQMGQNQAATVLAAILERFAMIKSPSAYLRVLGRKAELGIFSCAVMIRALDHGKSTSSAGTLGRNEKMLRC